MCPSRFARRPDLTMHLKSHLPDDLKQFECGDCGKKFTKQTALDVHERTHTGARPYQCVFCTRSFISSSSRTRHIRTHIDEPGFNAAAYADMTKMADGDEEDPENVSDSGTSGSSKPLTIMPQLLQVINEARTAEDGGSANSTAVTTSQPPPLLTLSAIAPASMPTANPVPMPALDLFSMMMPMWLPFMAMQFPLAASSSTMPAMFGGMVPPPPPTSSLPGYTSFSMPTADGRPGPVFHFPAPVRDAPQLQLQQPSGAQ